MPIKDVYISEFGFKWGSKNQQLQLVAGAMPI